MPERLGNHIEVKQRDAGRLALGKLYPPVSKKLIEGEIGLSFFDVVETTSTMMYSERIKRMDLTRWPNRVLTATEITSTKASITVQP